jgi:hypothetical protein
MKKFLISALALSALSSSAYAGCSASGCNGLITKLYMTAGGTLYVATNGNEKALNCAGGAGNGGVSGKYMSLKEGDIGKNAMYSLLLTSQTTKKPVSIVIQQNTTDCRVLYVTTN